MKIEDIIRLMEKVNENFISEFTFKAQDEEVYIKKNISNMLDETQTEKSMGEQHQNDLRKFIIKSPLVGTFYAAPTEDSPAFVKVGDLVDEKQVVCIIEAMKLMNEVKSDVKGRVKEILVQNGSMVEYGEPLVVLELI